MYIYYKKSLYYCITLVWIASPFHDTCSSHQQIALDTTLEWYSQFLEMACWRWASPFKSLQFKSFAVTVHRDWKVVCSYMFSEMVKQASPKLWWDERCWDETMVDGNALTFLVYPQSKIAELCNEEHVAYWTKSPSVAKWYRLADVTCLQVWAAGILFLPFLSSLKHEAWIHYKLLSPNICVRFRTGCGNNCRKIIRNLWLPVHEIRSIFCYSLAKSKKRTALKNILFTLGLHCNFVFSFWHFILCFLFFV